MPSKLNLASRMQTLAVNASVLLNECRDVRAIFNDRGYDSTNPYTDPEVVALNITAADIANFVLFVDNFVKLMGNNAVTTDKYAKYCNLMRSDL